MVLLAYEIELVLFYLTHKKESQPRIGAHRLAKLAVMAQGCWYFKVYSKT